MVVERTEDRGTLQFFELRQFLISPLGSAAISHVKSCQRPHAVHAIRISLGFVVRGFQVTPTLDFFTQTVEVAGGIEAVSDKTSGRISDPKLAVVEGDAAVLLDHSHEERREIAETDNLLAKWLNAFLVPIEGPVRDRDHFRNRGENGISILLAEGFADPTRHHPCRMNALASQSFNNLLPELTQPNSVARQLRIPFENSPQVALRRIGVHAEQEIGRRKVKHAKRMRLHDLRHIENAAKLVGRRRNTDRKQGIAGFGRSNQMTHGANSANPG